MRDGVHPEEYWPKRSPAAKAFSEAFYNKDQVIQLFGRLYPSDKFHYLIGSIASDSVIPIIVIFDKHGNNVSSELALGGFGSGPEGYGISYGIIEPDKSFTITDSSFFHTYIYELDSIVPNSGICTATVSEYKILDNGTFQLVKSDTVKTLIPD